LFALLPIQEITMKHLLAALAFGALALPQAMATATTVGSFLDGSMHHDPGTVNQIFQTEWWGHTSGGHQIGGSDLLFWNGDGGTLVLYDARIFVTEPIEVYPDGIATLTTVYGKASTPGHVTGFALSGTEFMPASQETHKGKSGAAYLSFSGAAVASHALAATLPGFDLTPFDQSTDSIYWVYQTSVPVSEIAGVPEPQTYALWLLGLGTLGALRRRR
jgi:MYXO-CTERM domain-containing protein